MRRHPTVPDDRVGASEGYDWSRFGRHRLRTAAAVLLDHPISPSGWAATVWADSVDPSGWRGFRWEPGAAGGWELPSRFVLGDVVELGSGSARWVGVVDGYEPGGWLTLRGPYDDRTAAAADAERLLAAERFEPVPEVHAGIDVRRRCRHRRIGRHR